MRKKKLKNVGAHKFIHRNYDIILLVWKRLKVLGSIRRPKKGFITNFVKQCFFNQILHVWSSYWVGNKVISLFSLDDFSRSKSFFSIANFRPYMVFDSWRFIDYSVKKKISTFVVYLLFCIDLKWRFQMVIFVTFYFITSEKVKTQSTLGKSCMMFMVKNH